MSQPAEAALQPAGDAGENELRCVRCGDVIGVYEPVIALIAGAPVRTSRAAIGAGRLQGTASFHVDCFPDGSPARGREAIANGDRGLRESCSRASV